ncbi:RNA polymerase sigma factor [Actinoplanes sp. NPDC049599]|uniref:RNA polymerase sigma factor n=1 Tax=Actinoplanes sp. NPDC049599 TaxID=3363903 RepID=UPI0037AB7B22
MTVQEDEPGGDAGRQRPLRAVLPEPASALDGRAGFDRFYQTWYGRVCAQVHAYLNDRAEAEDLVQEAFLRAWQRWSDIHRYDDPVAWVRRVAWNLATSRLRRLVVAGRVLRKQAPPAVTPGADPDHVALVAALRRLPERQRRVIVLHHIADLPVVEIAAELGVPKGTVVSWLHRGRAQLAAQLSEAGPPRTAANGSGEAVQS